MAEGNQSADNGWTRGGGGVVRGAAVNLLMCYRGGCTKGVGPSTTLAWPAWKQPDIPVEVDTARLETNRTYIVKELPGYPVQNSPSGSFLF